MGVSVFAVFEKLFIKYTWNTILYTINAEMKNLQKQQYIEGGTAGKARRADRGGGIT